MIKFKKIFKKIIYDEIGSSYMHGITLRNPLGIFMKPKDDSVKLLESNYLLTIPNSLKMFYNEIDRIEIIWNILDDGKNIQQFKDDEWLIEHYFNKGYEWEVIEEYLSGYINITKSENIFNPNFCKEQAYYYTLSNLDVNQDDFFPFDIHWSLSACLKKENGKIIDNIWLVHTDAETIYDMKITVEEYLDLAYQTKGFHYWQLNYILRKKSDYFELMKRFLPKIVPHVKLDLSAFGIKK